MKAATACFLILGLTAVLPAQDLPEMPMPQKEHEWLTQLAGEWTFEAEASMGPDDPPVKCTGSERIRTLGGFWIIAEGESTLLGATVNTRLTIGYDPAKKKYVGNWVDSMQTHMWTYEGTLDETGKILTLETEGPSLTEPGKTAKYKEKIELKGKDEKIFTSSVQTPDGKWFQFMTSKYTRKK